MITISRALASLARFHGVQPSYVDARRRRHSASEQTLWRILRAMGVDLPEPGDALDVLRAARRHIAPVPPVVVAWDGRVPILPIQEATAHSAALVRARLTAESGEVWNWAVSPGQPFALGGTLPAGYHQLQLSWTGSEHAALVVSSPSGPRAQIGASVQRTSGVEVSTLLAQAGDHEPPSSRLFWNESLIDGPPRSMSFKGEPAGGAAYHPQHHEELLAWARAKPFAEDYAAFRAVEYLRREPWSAWPEPQRNGFIRLLEAPEDRRRVHLYAQWLADGQAAAICRPPAEGLRLELPFAIHRDGYDLWRRRRLFAVGASVGLDPLEDPAPSGVPLRPEELRRGRFEYLIACLRHLLRPIQALHIRSRARLYWQPADSPDGLGAYVQYPEEEILAVTILESVRAGTRLLPAKAGVPEPLEAALQGGAH